MTHYINLILLLLALSGCTTQTTTLDIANLNVKTIPVPAAAGSAQPSLFTGLDDTVYLSWIESNTEQNSTLKFSLLGEQGWSNPSVIVQDNQLLSNWADFPSLTELNDGSLVAYWPTKNPRGGFATDVNIAFSQNNGTSWSKPIIAHQDGTATEHGFVSLLPWGNDQLLTVWLDGRNKDTTMLRSAVFSNRGKRIRTSELDANTCTCCQTSAALLSNKRAMVAYRDHDNNEKRDMSYILIDDQQQSKPMPLFDDNWIIGACPVNGPVIANHGQLIATAWYAAPDNQPEIKVNFSTDGGNTFEKPIRIDGGKPMGRVDQVMLDDGSVVVSWLEQDETDAHIRVGHIHQNGSMAAPRLLTLSSISHASGFPRITRTKTDLIFAWVDFGKPTMVKSARIPIHQFLAEESKKEPEDKAPLK